MLPCPVDVPLPPAAPPISCGSQTYLKLFPNGRYETNLPVFARYAANKGQFAVVPFVRGSAIVFDDDGAGDEPRAYRMVLGKAGKKAPTTLAVSATMYVAGAGEQVFTMNFTRYAG